MTVVVVSDCPPKLRGDLTKWLLEISTGVYVGKINARVRDELWNRICENLKHGRATMVYHTNNEQRMDFRVHNTLWEPVDYDGIKLVRRPSPRQTTDPAPGSLKPGFSNAAHQQMARRRTNAGYTKKAIPPNCCILDIETTGLDCMQNEITEIAALRIRDGAIKESFSTLVRINKPLPPTVTELTGLTDQDLDRDGISLSAALQNLLQFVGEDTLVCHNAPFDGKFLQAACKSCGIPSLRNPIIDTLPLTRRRIRDVTNYKLETLAAFFGISSRQEHRALADCHLTYRICVNLNEL